ncbi:MAG: head GIN domain-containing protein [Chitinophagaceae bacterium]
MKKLLLLSFFALAAFALKAQKTVYDANAEARAVGSFNAIQLSNAFSVVITQGAEEGLAVSASNADEIQNIKTKVEGGVLKIWYDNDKKWNRNNSKLRAYISVKTLDAIKAGGACDVKIEGTLNAQDLRIDLSGASDVSGKLNVSGNLKVNLNGASDLAISGMADNMSIDASGASEVKAYDFAVSNCSVEASGASSVQVTVDKELSAQLSGASSVRYKGTAIIKDIKTSGASSIARKS